MLVSVINAEYLEEYKILLHFDNGEQGAVDLKNTIFSDHRKIFKPLQDVEFFQKFELDSWTLIWPNEADFSPEFLYELAINKTNSQKTV